MKFHVITPLGYPFAALLTNLIPNVDLEPGVGVAEYRCAAEHAEHGGCDGGMNKHENLHIKTNSHSTAKLIAY